MPSNASAGYAVLPAQPAAPAHARVPGWLVPVVVVTCLVVVALFLAFRPAAPAPAAARVIHVETPPDAAAVAREQAAIEAARVKAEDELRASILGAHQERIDACFAKRPKRSEAPTGVSMRFAVDPSGKVTNVDVFPEDLGKTALGRCLRIVGRSTRFPATSGEQSFSIPVSAGE